MPAKSATCSSSYANIEAIETPDARTVAFRLDRPPPSLLPLLASGYSPVIPAHVPIAEHRSRCVGTAEDRDGHAKFYENYACGSPRNYGDYCGSLAARLLTD